VPPRLRTARHSAPTGPDTTAQEPAGGLSRSESGQRDWAASAQRTARSWLGRSGRLLGYHWPAAVLFAAGVALRVISLLAYHPALLYVDSLKYLYGTWPGSDPVGYRVLLKLILAVGDLGTVVVVQHLLGLALAVGIYVLLMRRGVNRWLGALAIAPVLLDGYQLQAEQTIMPDVMFEVIVAAVLIVLLWRPAVSWRRVAAVGLLLGLAVTVHQVGLILIVPVVAYLLLLRGPLFSRGGWGEALAMSAAMCVAFAVPVLAYSAYNYQAHGHFRISNNGHAVGRLAMAADCATLRVPADARQLCPTAAQQKYSPDWYEHSRNSPLARIAVPRREKVKLVATLDHAVERQQPLRVIGAVLRDSIRLFEVDRTNSLAITPINRWRFQPYYPSYLPEILAQPDGDIIVGLQYRLGVPFHYVLLNPAWGGKWQFDRPLARFLHNYQVDGGYTPGPLLLLFTLAGLLGSLYALFATRRASPRARQLALCSLVYFVSAAGILLVSDFFVFSWRYQMQAVTTLPPAGVFAATAAIEAVRHRRHPADPG
jgi:hypothetical protein